MPNDPILSTPTPLHDAIDKIGTSGEGFELDAVRDQSGHAGVSVGGTKNVGKGWSLSGAFQWAKDAGYAVMGKVRWTPKQ